MEDDDCIMGIAYGCGGWCLHWPFKSAGQSLQGWYADKHEMEKVAVICRELLRKEKLLDSAAKIE